MLAFDCNGNIGFFGTSLKVFSPLVEGGCTAFVPNGTVECAELVVYCFAEPTVP